MDEPLSNPQEAAFKVREVLHAIAELLRDVPPLGPEAQQLLAEIIDELSRSLEAETVPPAELSSLAQHVSELISAAHAGEDTGLIGSLRAQVERLAAAVESRAPLVAGLTRRLIETLSEIGI
jgi:hypothetical protein